jgi:hypothetical protein
LKAARSAAAVPLKRTHSVQNAGKITINTRESANFEKYAPASKESVMRIFRTMRIALA